MMICITADGLYPCRQVFEICRENNWRYIIRFKEGCIPTLYDSYRGVRKKCPPGQSFRVTVKGRSGEKDRDLDYFYANGFTYDEFIVNIAECKDSGVEYAFVFITDLHIRWYDCERTVMYGRRRWRIENEGFKVQKKHGYYLKHQFSKDANAMKIHYLLIQIAHAISQLMEHGSNVMKKLKLAKKQLREKLYECFKKIILTDDDLIEAEVPRKIRLVFLS